jgi:hypothetical protein
MSEKTILITGASGLLGRAVYKYFVDETYRNKYPIEDFNADFKWNCIGLCNKRYLMNIFNYFFFQLLIFI